MNKPQVSIIVAIDEKRGIGKNNELLFKISEDLKRFKKLTRGHAVIMGIKTYESIVSYNGKHLPGRLNIVLSRTKDRSDQTDYNSPLATATNLSTALKYAEEWEQAHFSEEKTREVFILGGEQIFKQALEENLVDRIYLTKVNGEYHADAFFPDYENLGFKTKEREDKESDGYIYSFITLKK